jgi:hypothetical protein
MLWNFVGRGKGEEGEVISIGTEEERNELFLLPFHRLCP